MVTLAEIEQAAAPRCGPYYADQASGGTVNPPTVIVTNLTSTIDLGGWEDLWLLRRGLLAAGTAVPGYTTADRQRRVKSYDPLTGTLTLDRIYTTAPVATELIELHHLDPANELRPAVLAGLKRCYMVDRADIVLASNAAERNLTAAAPWITNPEQVLGLSYATSLVPAPGAPTVATGAAGVLTGAYTYRVTFVTATGETQGGVTSAVVSPVAQQVALTGIPIAATSLAGVTARKLYRTTAGGMDGTQKLVATIADNTTTVYADNVTDANLGVGVPFVNSTLGVSLPIPMWWKGLSLRGGKVWYGAAPDPSPNTLMVLSRRAHWSFVNNALSVTGPTADTDTLAVLLEYAAAAAHIEAWRLYRDRLQDAADEGRRLSLKETADVFTDVAKDEYKPPPSEADLTLPFSGGGPGSSWTWRTSLQ